MLPADAEKRTKAFELIRQVLPASGTLSAEDTARLTRVARLFGIGEGGASPFRQVRAEREAKAS